VTSAGKGVHISQAHAIISELLASLDFEVGGELAHEPRKPVPFMLGQLMAAHIKNEPKALDAVLSILRPLYVSWEGAHRRERQRMRRNSSSAATAPLNEPRRRWRTRSKSGPRPRRRGPSLAARPLRHRETGENAVGNRFVVRFDADESACGTTTTVIRC
jgi:hypothetical protein